MALGIAGAVGGDAEGAVAEDAGGGVREKGAVDAAAVGDDQAGSRERAQGRPLGSSARQRRSTDVGAPAARAWVTRPSPLSSIVVLVLVVVVVDVVVLVVLVFLVVVIVVVVVVVVGELRARAETC